jgi:hypothetical protein
MLLITLMTLIKLIDRHGTVLSNSADQDLQMYAS